MKPGKTDAHLRRRINYVGQRFGRLLAVEMQYEPKTDSKVRCKCDCGTEKVVLIYNLKNGNTTSCGCLSREKTAERSKHLGALMGDANRTHGFARTPTYVSWCDAKKRCYNPKNKRYAEYGGRGIGMCDDWRTSFENFLQCIGPRPEGMTLERLDVNKGYEPGNCIWATAAQQAQNTRTNVATWESVRRLRCRRASGATYAQLALEFCMSYNNVRLICTGKTWREDSDAS